MDAPGAPLPASAQDLLRRTMAQARQGLVERDALVEAVVLAAVAGEHVLVIGPPGTAKSEAVRRVAQALGGQTFEYLLGRFTEPNEIFGPIDLRRLREGQVETETTGMLPEAEFAFLDEVFLGSTAILNTLLGILNERVFRRGHTVRRVPLRVCVGASNAMPDDSALAAFADRFLLHCFVEPVADAFLETLLQQGWPARGGYGAIPGALAALDELAAALPSVDLDPVRPKLAHAVRRLRNRGIVLPDRRIVRLQKLVAAAALLDGRQQASAADLWPLIYALPSAQAQASAREVLAEELLTSHNDVLRGAVAEASQGIVAQAARVADLATEVLAQRPAAEEQAAWLQRLEGLARDIDAQFAEALRPAELVAVRKQLGDVLGSAR